MLNPSVPHLTQFATEGPPLPPEADGDDFYLHFLTEVGRLVVLTQFLKDGFEFFRVFPDDLAGEHDLLGKEPMLHRVIAALRLFHVRRAGPGPQP